MENVIIETVVQIVATLLITLIGVLGTWLTDTIAKKHELANIAAATDEATKAAQTTVLELQQTTVEAMKAASADGKLTQSEIEELGSLLLQKALQVAEDCPCTYGCPSCVGPVGEVGEDGKRTAIRLLRELTK